MRPGTALDLRMADLAARQVPFVKATVVRARRPASAHPGDTALVLPDGRIEGFVGGICTESTVRLQALNALHSGESVLLRISPEALPEEGGAAAAAEDGTLVVGNPCLSGGELEIFLEPLRPVPRVLVLGDSPIGRALLALGPALDYETRGVEGGTVTADALDGIQAVVVASHGRDEESLLTLAARAQVPYIGLVASRRRGAAVLAALDLTAEQRARIRTPAGLWIGARTPGEIAVSILAEVIATLRGVGVEPGEGGEGEGAGSRSDSDSGSGSEPASTSASASEPVPEPPAAAVGSATDPVCGMTVATVADTAHSDAAGQRRWFCGEGCRSAFEADPTRYAEAR